MSTGTETIESAAGVVETFHWQRFFASVAAHLKTVFRKAYPFENDGDVSPEILALRDAFHSFPVPADILLIDTEGQQSPISEGRFWTLIKYQFARSQQNDVNFHGVMSIRNLEEALLATCFNLTDPSYLVSVRDLTLHGFIDAQLLEFVEFVPFDIRAKEQHYGKHLFDDLLVFYGEELVRCFKKEIDFNAIYNLEGEPVLSERDLLQRHELTSLFVSLATFKPPTLEQVQREIRDVLLIPQVTEDVKRTFHLAKRAYLFAYFEYGFFTMSQHYAYLTLEAAVHARWTATLGKNVELKHGAETVIVEHTSHHGLRRFCEGRGWSIFNLLVNGKRYPRSMRMVLDDLRQKKIITNWQRGRIENGMKLRNALSHREFASVSSPSAGTLRYVAELVNQLFHTLPIPGNVSS